MRKIKLLEKAEFEIVNKKEFNFYHGKRIERFPIGFLWCIATMRC